MSSDNESGIKKEESMLDTILGTGNLASLTPEERSEYYQQICTDFGLNPLTNPFQYIDSQQGLVLCATKNATEQLARIHGISIRLDDGREVRGAWVLKATATDGTGRAVDAIGVVNIETSKGQDIANSLIWAEEKASRRAVLRLCGLGVLDEFEVGPFSKLPTVKADTNQQKQRASTESGAKAWETIYDALETEEQFNEELKKLLSAKAKAPDEQRRMLWSKAKRNGLEYNSKDRIFYNPCDAGDDEVGADGWPERF